MQAQRVMRALALLGRREAAAATSVVVSPLRDDEMGCEMAIQIRALERKGARSVDYKVHL